MKILLLRNDFYKIDELYKQNSDSKAEFGENLLKMIMRVMKMREAKNVVGKIVGLVWNRIIKIQDIKKILKKEEPEDSDGQEAS